MSNAYVEAASVVVDTIGGAIKILEESRPTVDRNQVLATAMPEDLDPMSSPAQGVVTLEKWYLQGWEFMGEPYSSQCKVHISFAWGARYHGGGAFIPSVWAWVDEIDVPEMWVPWSHDLDITFDAGQPYTQEVGEGRIYACLPLEVRLKEETTIDTAEDTWRFILYGNGGWEEQ